jgi:hephaestin
VDVPLAHRRGRRHERRAHRADDHHHGRPSAPDGSPADARSREFVRLCDVADENARPYLDENIRRLADAKHVNPDDEEFTESNLVHSINGFVSGNGPGGTATDAPAYRMRRGERARWYLMDMGTEVDLHTPHWRGNTATVMGMPTDVVQVLPGTLQIAT